MKLLCASIVLAVCSATSALAHDIGVSQAELVAQSDTQFTLSVRTGSANGLAFPSPLLPASCEFSGNPGGEQALAWRIFEFSCADGLTADHVIELPWRRDGIVLKAIWLDGSEVEQLLLNTAGRIVVPLAELQAGSGSFFSAAKRYTTLGVEHILLGFDHLLFILALLLLVSTTWTLVKTITAFTVAHSITLGLATLGFIYVPTLPVEAAIALSIVFLCAEIVHVQQGKAGLTYRYPWMVAFMFGLLHGLGFAGALSAVGIPRGEIPVALLFFNIGVEIGQLLFVFGVLVGVWLLRRLRLEQQQWVRVMPAYLIGTLATYWFVERGLLILRLG